MSRELLEKMARAMLDAREMAKVSDARWGSLWPNSIKGQELEVMARAVLSLLADPANITPKMAEALLGHGVDDFGGDPIPEFMDRARQRWAAAIAAAFAKERADNLTGERKP